MNKNTIIGIIIGAVIAVAAGLVGFSFHSSVPKVALVGGVAGQGEPTGFDNVNLTGSLVTGVNPAIYPPAIPTQFATGTVYAQGDLIQGGLCTIVDSSTTQASIILLASQLQCTELSVTTATTSSLTLVMPASSTIGYLQNSGDETDTYVYAASTTGGSIILAATSTGGFTLNSAISAASTTAATTTILAGQVGQLLNIKLPTSNIIGMVFP